VISKKKNIIIDFLNELEKPIFTKKKVYRSAILQWFYGCFSARFLSNFNVFGLDF
jgi:hypothetical protein